MIVNGTYMLQAAARKLHRAGEWDVALALLDGQPGAEVAELRALILVDRHFWRLDDPTSAQAAVDGVDPASAQASFLRAQLAYVRMIFGGDPWPGDAQTVDAGFRAAARDGSLRGWGTFWLGVAAEHVHADPVTAKAHYDTSLEVCRAERDLLLESYVVRHLGAHAIERDQLPDEGEMLLRRSLHLRSALGARPQVAAAQATLAGELPDGREREVLREMATATAQELGLAWLAAALAKA